MENKKKKIGAIIADVFLFLFLTAHILFYLFCLDGIISGVNTGWFGAEHIEYGWDAFINNFEWGVLIFVIFVPITPVTALYDIVYFIIKKRRKTLKAYEKIALIATAALILPGFILFMIGSS